MPGGTGKYSREHTARRASVRAPTRGPRAQAHLLELMTVQVQRQGNPPRSRRGNCAAPCHRFREITSSDCLGARHASNCRRNPGSPASPACRALPLAIGPLTALENPDRICVHYLRSVTHVFRKHTISFSGGAASPALIA